MNQPLQTIEAASVANQALVTLDPETYAAAVYEPFKARLHAAVITADCITYNIQTKEGMAVAKEHRAILRAIRIDADKERAARKAPITAIGKLLESKYAEIENAVTPYEEKFHADIKAEEDRIETEKAAKLKAEEDAKAAIQNKIDAIKNKPLEVMNKSVADIEEAIAELSPLVPTPAEFGERFIEAEYALKATLDTLASIVSGKKAQEQIEAQNRALQAEQAAREAEAQLAAKEQARVDGIKAKIQAIKNNIIAASECDFSSQIAELMAGVDDLVITEQVYQEFTAEAAEIKTKTFNALKRQHDALLQSEKEEAELKSVIEAKEKLEAEAKQAAAAAVQEPVNNVINEADFNKYVGVVEVKTKDEIREILNTKTSVPRPAMNEIVSLVSRSYGVDYETGYNWLVEHFTDRQKAT